MKQKIIALLMMLLATWQITSCAQTRHSKEQNIESKKTLVAFFSRAGENYGVGNIEKGNTHIIAEMIAAETGSDLFHILPVTSYPSDYTECTTVAKRELNANARPTIQGDAAVEDYDIIFIGSGRRFPMPGFRIAEQLVQLTVGEGEKLINALAA